jgi:hypothetical protein
LTKAAEKSPNSLEKSNAVESDFKDFEKKDFEEKEKEKWFAEMEILVREITLCSARTKRCSSKANKCFHGEQNIMVC